MSLQTRATHGKDWPLTCLNTEVNIIFRYLKANWHQFPCHNKSHEKHFRRTWNHRQEKSQFSESYDREGFTSSPLFPQSNGFAERMVQIVKNTTHTEAQVWRERRGSVRWNNVLQNSTCWPSIKVTRKVTQHQWISNHLPVAQEISSRILSFIKSKKAFVSDNKDGHNNTTGPQDRHYQRYMMVNQWNWLKVWTSRSVLWYLSWYPQSLSRWLRQAVNMDM